MQLNARGTLKIFLKKSFEKDGETIEYSQAYFLTTDENGDNDVLKVNTKQDLSRLVGVDGEVFVNVRDDGKIALIDFKVDQ